MNASSALQAVIVSNDASVLETMPVCLGELGIHASVHQPSSLIDALATCKIDVFFVDQDSDPELALIQHVRTSSSSRTAVIFALAHRSRTSSLAFGGADFVIDKPLVQEHVTRALRAAYGIMLKERRRYTRYALACRAIVQDSTSRQFLAATTNISQTGLALECAAPLVAGEKITVRLRLPHCRQISNFGAQVIWTATNAKVGLTFTGMSLPDRERLSEWIDGEFLRQWHALIPETVAERFTHAAR
ncbi:MAG TPA: PilZ domain-containing protein [Terriglobales bacterium]|nr:PilZ domain-containing protein [Terriglobales bacterium]